MHHSGDFSAVRASLVAAEPASRYTMEVPILWEVLEVYGGSLDQLIADDAAKLHISLTEDRSNPTHKVYAMAGTGRDLLTLLDTIQTNMDSPDHFTFTFRGSNANVATLHQQLLEVRDELGVKLHVTPYSGRWRSSIVVEVSGRTADVAFVQDLIVQLDRVSHGVPEQTGPRARAERSGASVAAAPRGTASPPASQPASAALSL